MTKKKAKTKLTGDELRSKLAERARRMPWRQFSDSLLPDEHRELTFFGGSGVAGLRIAGPSSCRALRCALPESNKYSAKAMLDIFGSLLNKIRRGK